MIEEINLLLSQTYSYQESQFLAYLIAVIIGIQLGFYFFYQFYKIQDVYLKLNRILLSLGSFILLIILGALSINVSRLFFTDSKLKTVIHKNWLGLCTVFSNWVFIIYSFKRIFNNNEFKNCQNNNCLKFNTYHSNYFGIFNKFSNFYCQSNIYCNGSLLSFRFSNKINKKISRNDSKKIHSFLYR